MKKPNIESLMGLVASAMRSQEAGAMDHRNVTAYEIFRHRQNRLVTVGSLTVETWWDATSRNFITQIKDESGVELLASEFSGDATSASVQHLQGLHYVLNAPSRQRAAEVAAAIECVRIKDRLLEAVQMAYRKHHLDDEDVGWDQLSDVMQNALCEAMGDDAFQQFIEEHRRQD